MSDSALGSASNVVHSHEPSLQPINTKIFSAVFTDQPLKLDEILSQCCTSGEDLATNEEECKNFKPALDTVPAELISACFFSSEICCSSKLRIDQCKSGVLAAKDGQDCHSPQNKTGSDFYKNCCEVCKIGLVVGTTQDVCSIEPFAYGQPFDDAFNYCCQDIKTGDEFVLTDDDSSYCATSFVYGPFNYFLSRGFMRQV